MVTQSRNQTSSSDQCRKWEKDRRDRFNSFLSKLSSLLPSHASSTEEERRKRSKVAIVQEAIVYIQELEMTQMSEETMRKMRLMRKQNRRLRDLIRNEVELDISEEQFMKLSFDQIKLALKKSRKPPTDQIEPQERPVPKDISSGDNANSAKDVERERPERRQKENEEVFVATLSNSCLCDHNYSLVVQEEPNIEIVAQEEEIVNDEQIVLESSHTLFEQQSLQQNVSSSQSISLVSPLVLKPPETMIMVHQPLALSAVPWKLPLPRLEHKRRLKKRRRHLQAEHEKQREQVAQQQQPEQLQDQQDQQPVVACRPDNEQQAQEEQEQQVQEQQLPEEQEQESAKKRKIASNNEDALVSTNTRTASSVESNNDQLEAPNGSQSVIAETEVPLSDKDVTLVSKSPPLSLLAEEPISTKESKSDVNESRQKRSLARGNKYNKSSYSIAALCQISVNIGEPHPEVSNSPGLASLASAGTASPAATDGARSPSTPINSRQLVSLDISTHKSTANKASEKVGNKDGTNVVMNNAAPGESQPPLLSPTKTFLTSFPVVAPDSNKSTMKKKSDVSSNNNVISGNKDMQRSKDLSVFDFNDSAEDTLIRDKKDGRRPVINATKKKTAVQEHLRATLSTSRSSGNVVITEACNRVNAAVTESNSKRKQNQQSSTSSSNLSKSSSMQASSAQSAPFVDPQMVMSLMEPQAFTAPPPYNTAQFSTVQYGGQNPCGVMTSSMPFYSSNTMEPSYQEYSMHQASMPMTQYQQSFGQSNEFSVHRQTYVEMPQQPQLSKYKSSKKSGPIASTSSGSKSKSQKKSQSGTNISNYNASSSSSITLPPMISGSDGATERLFSVHQLVSEKHNGGRALKGSTTSKRSSVAINNSNFSSSRHPRVENTKKDEVLKSGSNKSTTCVNRSGSNKKSKIALSSQSSYSAESLLSVPPSAPISILAEPYYDPGASHGGVMWSHNNATNVPLQANSYNLQVQPQQSQQQMLMSFSSSPNLFGQTQDNSSVGANNTFEMLPTEPIFLPPLARSKTIEESSTPNCSSASFLENNAIFPFPTLTPPNPDVDHFNTYVQQQQAFGCQQQRNNFQNYKNMAPMTGPGSVSNFHLSTLFPEMSSAGKKNGRDNGNALPSINTRPEDLMAACDPIFMPH